VFDVLLISIKDRNSSIESFVLYRIVCINCSVRSTANATHHFSILDTLGSKTIACCKE